jgi:hypothetical protein
MFRGHDDLLWRDSGDEDDATIGFEGEDIGSGGMFFQGFPLQIETRSSSGED